LQDPEHPNTSSEEDEESSSEESSEEEEGSAGPSAALAEDITREQRRREVKARKEAAAAKKHQVGAQPGDLPSSESDEEEQSDSELPANPNHTAKSRSQATKGPVAEPPADTNDVSQLSRREREAIQAQQARERYLKLHAEGKTEEARADLARLAVVRERREAEKARKEAEREEKEARERERTEVRDREKAMREAALGTPSRGPKKPIKKK
jgi:Casein kinase substrate phosphoprotein PP28